MTTLRISVSTAPLPVRVRFGDAWDHVLARLPPRAQRVVTRTPPAIHLLRQMPFPALAECRPSLRRLEFLWPTFEYLDNNALRGLIAHELCHWFRFVTGVVWPQTDEELRPEDFRTNRLMIRCGFGYERAMLTVYKRRIPADCWPELLEVPS